MINDDKPLQTELAKLGYEAYGRFRDWKTHDGKKMPVWDDIGSNIQQGWIEATIAIVTEVGRSECDRGFD